MKNIYLIGFMGSGKSTVARELAGRMSATCIEMDEQIEEQQQMPITQIFEEYGEAYFRGLETEFLRSLVDKENIIVSCGGGSVLRDENAKMMKEHGTIVFLTAKPQTIYERVKDSTNRPILNGNMTVGYIEELMEKRRERYEAVADVSIVTDGKSVAEICAEIMG